MESQNKQILAHLRSGRSLNPLQALEHFGCFRLSARIYDLKKSGIEIETHRGYNIERDKFFAIYALKP